MKSENISKGALYYTGDIDYIFLSEDGHIFFIDKDDTLLKLKEIKTKKRMVEDGVQLDMVVSDDT